MAQRSRVCLGCSKALDIAGRRNWPEHCSDACKPRCAVESCGGVVRKRGWCASHYHQWRATGGDPKPFIRKWADSRPCLVCGSAEHERGFRRFCGGACAALYRTYGGHVPVSTGCVLCGTTIDLTVRGKRGQRRKASTKLCRPCKQDYSKYKMTARQLALRDGAVCGICRGAIDMSVRRADDAKWCASVDHVLPRALGGSQDPSNLQLAHLHCNQVKSDLRGATP